MNQEFVIEVATKLGAVEQTAKAAHARMDGLQTEFKDALKELSKDLKDLNAHMAMAKLWGPKIETLTNDMHEKKGAKTVLVIIGSVVGSVITMIAGHFLK